MLLQWRPLLKLCCEDWSPKILVNICFCKQIVVNFSVLDDSGSTGWCSCCLPLFTVTRDKHCNHLANIWNLLHVDKLGWNFKMLSWKCKTKIHKWMHWPTPKSVIAFELFGSIAAQFNLQSWSPSKRIVRAHWSLFFAPVVAKDGFPMAIVGTRDRERA